MLCKCTGLLPVRGLTCALCRQHFGTTARDAAAALGVSKSTLYRIRVRSDGGFAPWPGLATKCALARTVRTPYSDFIGAAKKEVAECKAKLRAAKAAAKSTAPRSTVHFKRMNEGPCAMARRRHGNPQVVQQICSEGSALQWDATAGCYHVLDGEAFESRFDELRRKRKRGEGAQTHNRPFMHMHKHYTLLADDGWSQSDGWAKTGSRFIPVSAACSAEATLTEAKRVRREESSTGDAAPGKANISASSYLEGVKRLQTQITLEAREVAQDQTDTDEPNDQILSMDLVEALSMLNDMVMVEEASDAHKSPPEHVWKLRSLHLGEGVFRNKDR